MTKQICCSLFFLSLFFLSQAQNSNADSDIESLKNLNAKFINNFVTNDTLAHSKILHPDFVCIAGNGSIFKRQDYLNDWAHGFEGFVYFDYRDEDIKILGSIALVHSKNKWIIHKTEKKFQACLFIQIFT